jgi:hypothetical protein
MADDWMASNAVVCTAQRARALMCVSALTPLCAAVRQDFYNYLSLIYASVSENCTPGADPVALCGSCELVISRPVSSRPRRALPAHDGGLGAVPVDGRHGQGQASGTRARRTGGRGVRGRRLTRHPRTGVVGPAVHHQRAGLHRRAHAGSDRVPRRCAAVQARRRRLRRSDLRVRAQAPTTPRTSVNASSGYSSLCSACESAAGTSAPRGP